MVYDVLPGGGCRRGNDAAGISETLSLEPVLTGSPVVNGVDVATLPLMPPRCIECAKSNERVWSCAAVQSERVRSVKVEGATVFTKLTLHGDPRIEWRMR